MPQATERTRLLVSDDSKPQYVFDTSIARGRKRRIKQFQCCLCAIFLTIFVTALVVVIAFTLNTPPEPDNSAENSTDVLASTVVVLLANSYPLPDKEVRLEFFDGDQEWNDAFAAADAALMERDKIEQTVPEVPHDSPSYRHQKIVATSSRARRLARLGSREEFAIRYIHKGHTGRNSPISRICLKANDSSAEYCRIHSRRCDLYQKYRAYNGSCNNFDHPTDWGVAFLPFRRSLPPDYSDGISQPRMAISGQHLPSARVVSAEVHRPYYRNDDRFTVMLAVWGQFLDHDMTATALSQGASGSSISCCSAATSQIHPECFPVIVPTNSGNSCMEFVRSAPAPTCCLGPREQLNQVTAFIDGSVVYGSTEDQVDKLRTFSGGLLEMYQTPDNRSLLPISTDLDDGCNRQEQNEKGRYCFLAGDGRANENLHLTSMHVIWARHHNRLAAKLATLNRHWSDERLFQEARRILGAQMQHITYNEFLPILLGPDIMEKSGLHPLRTGYFGGYNATVNPTIANCFATAAFRFAHTLIPGLVRLIIIAGDTSSAEYVATHKILFDPYRLYAPDGLDAALRGAMDAGIEASDAYFSAELKERLFARHDRSEKGPVRPCGLDLVSLNIQRGRDHGLVGYNSWRERCGLRRARTFDQLHGDIDDDSLINIRRIYSNVDDVDLYTGAVSERPLPGGLLGPTATCLILDQFVRTKFGDRFWYERGPGQPTAFAPAQLAEIRKTSLAGVVCANSDAVDTVQPRLMARAGPGNAPTACTALPAPHLGLWRETRAPISTDAVAVRVIH